MRDLYRDRWPIEQLPLAAKQLLGAHRQFVHASETRLRLPELALIAGSVLSYVAATSPAIPTGCWDRKPEPTPGRFRILLARTPFGQDFPKPSRIRTEASLTDQLTVGFWGKDAAQHLILPPQRLSLIPKPYTPLPDLAETRVYWVPPKTGGLMPTV